MSFADTTYGHNGTIYKAAGWKQNSIVKPNYVYVNNDGRMMHKKTLYNHARNLRKTESSYASEHGWRKVFGKEKIKFILERSQ